MHRAFDFKSEPIEIFSNAIITCSWRSICKILYEKRDIGNGFTCRFSLEKGSFEIYGLMTCNHIISRYIKDKSGRWLFNFEAIPSMHEANLVAKINGHHFQSNYGGYDITFIELTGECYSNWSDEGVKFLRVESALLGEEITILQYPLFELSRKAQGRIERFERSGFLVVHSAFTSERTSGTPLIDKYGNAVAIHQGILHRSGGNALENIALNMEYIVKGLKSQYYYRPLQVTTPNSYDISPSLRQPPSAAFKECRGLLIFSL